MLRRLTQGSIESSFCSVMFSGLMPSAKYGWLVVITMMQFAKIAMPTISVWQVWTYCSGHACGWYGSEIHRSRPEKPTRKPPGWATMPCRVVGGGVHVSEGIVKLFATKVSDAVSLNVEVPSDMSATQKNWAWLPA